MSFSVRSRKLSDKTDDPFVVNSYSEKEKEKSHKGVASYNKEEVSWTENLHDQLRITLLTGLSFYLRIMRLGFPGYITEMELETTRQVNWYMAGKLFIGKFPPLVGIVCTGLARIFGYYGTEDLTYAGQPFVEFPIVALRRFSAILGTALIPIAYITVRSLGHSRTAATLAAALLIFENGIVTQSRYATSEVYVLFFSALATCSWSLMHKHIQESRGGVTTGRSAFWQIMTGISLGCALSSKWTGALALPIIWTSTTVDIWNKLCEKQNQLIYVLKQCALYFLTFAVLPVSVYLTIFQFHLRLLPNAGDHDLLYSSQLKYSLIGNHAEASQPNIAYGSQIIIRHDGTVGGYLHSHKRQFSGGSKQQEVTVYPHIDINNIWTVHKATEMWNASQPIQFVRNKDQIRLEHFASSRKLHSHDHRPQLTNKKEHSEVTAYGDKLIQDSHDYWTLLLLTDENIPSKDRDLTWKSINQKFRLQHVRGCVLISHETYYAPPAGENHQEVTCMASAGTHISPWVAESSYHEKLENMASITFEKMSSWGMMKELHKLMKRYPAVVYSRLQTGNSKDGATRSSHDENPNKWFLKRAAYRVWSELAGYSAHVVLNPIVQRLTVLTMITYLGFLGLNAFLYKRQIKLPGYLSWLNSTGLEVINNDFYTRSVVLFFSAIIIQIGCLRFIPEYTLSMPDILGSMYYGTGLIAVVLEACTTRLPTALRRSILYGLLILSVIKFSNLSHLAYGGKLWYRSECEASGIDVDCIRFPPHALELVDIIENSGSTQNSTQFTIYVELAGGQSQEFRYNQGQEVEADRHIAVLKQASFSKEAQLARGTHRYHRVLPTPGITPEEAAVWAKENLEEAQDRENAMAAERMKLEAEQKTKEEKKKQRKQQKKQKQQEAVAEPNAAAPAQ